MAWVADTLTGLRARALSLSLSLSLSPLSLSLSVCVYSLSRNKIQNICPIGGGLVGNTTVTDIEYVSPLLHWLAIRPPQTFSTSPLHSPVLLDRGEEEEPTTTAIKKKKSVAVSGMQWQQ